MTTVDVWMTGRMVGGFDVYAPEVAAPRADSYREAYQANYQRIYCLAFWMTDSESAAEKVTANVFKRAFMALHAAHPEAFDRALICELRETSAIGRLTLQVSEPRQVLAVRSNARRVDLECAVVQLPPTERLIFLMHDVEGYEHARIAHLIGLRKEESIQGLHQARLRMRELLAAQK